MTRVAGPAFPPEEFAARLANVRMAMAAAELDGLVLGVPENIYYLTGLDHWGYFACHLLIVPAEGELILIARAMERITIDNQVHNARFLGHRDDEDIVDFVDQAVQALGLANRRLGYEERSLFITPRIADGVRAVCPRATWWPASGLVDGLRLTQSPLEIVYTRAAARAADAGTMAAIEAIHDGASDRAIAAACHAAMITAGSDYPGFGPFIRPTTRLGEEHTTWCGDVMRRGDAVFLELAAACRRYHAPMGRLIYVGDAPAGAADAAALAVEGMAAICSAIRPGVRAGDVYADWHAVAASAGLTDYHRHHCGYLVGIAFPPSWTGGSSVTGLAPHAEFPLKPGMVFHAHSWFTGTHLANYFISNTVLLGETGAEVLTSATPQGLTLR